jgi:hypothetical protein
VGSGNVQDTIDINVEGDLDLRNPTGSELMRVITPSAVFGVPEDILDRFERVAEQLRSSSKWAQVRTDIKLIPS